MNLRKIVGNVDNKQLLADIAIKFLPMAETQVQQMTAGIKGAKAGIRRAVDVQRDAKYILRRRNQFPANVIAWATKAKADANFDEHRYHAEKQGFLEGYREGRALEFMLKSIIKLAKEEA
ncbi:UNVERIFIED_CONTAM: hypothetical protein RF648_21375, partial [Kocuria sp. CPCC 205274]